jgi:hypothetical protein
MPVESGAFENAEPSNTIEYRGGYQSVGEVRPPEIGDDVSAVLWSSSGDTGWHLVEGSQRSAGPLIPVCEGIGYFRAEHNVAAVGDRLLRIGTALEGSRCTPRRLRDPKAHTYLTTSTDGGATWQELPVPQSLQNADDEYWNESVQTLIGDSVFLIAANDRPAILRSADGTSWEMAPLEGATDDSRVTQIVEFGGGYVALGWLEDISRRETRMVWYSPDGQDWRLTQTAGGDGNEYLSLTSFGSGILARGLSRYEPEAPFMGSVSVSFDGTGWSYPETPFGEHVIDQLISNGSSALAIVQNDVELGDQTMWRADLSEIRP